MIGDTPHDIDGTPTRQRRRNGEDVRNCTDNIGYASWLDNLAVCAGAWRGRNLKAAGDPWCWQIIR